MTKRSTIKDIPHYIPRTNSTKTATITTRGVTNTISLRHNTNHKTTLAPKAPLV